MREEPLRVWVFRRFMHNTPIGCVSRHLRCKLSHREWIRTGSVSLAERGDTLAVPRHPDFRIFAAMNPPTDFGKKDLPPGIRSRFTEIHVEPISSDEDIQLVVLQQLAHVMPHPPVQVFMSHRSSQVI